jgi:hypothetical protein
MNGEVFTLAVRNVRASDSNSLLRLYDQAKILVQRSSSQQERARADRAMRIFASELRKGQVHTCDVGQYSAIAALEVRRRAALRKQLAIHKTRFAEGSR